MANIMDREFLYSEIVLVPEHLAAIGSVAIESSNCERLIENIIWQLLGLEEDQGKFLTKGTQFQSSLELFLNLAKERLGDREDLTAIVTKIKSDIKEAVTDRNVIIHGEWKSPIPNFLALLSNGPAGYPPARAYKRTLNSAPTEFPAEKARDLALRFAHLSDELVQFTVDHWAEFLEPSLGKSELPPLSPLPT